MAVPANDPYTHLAPAHTSSARTFSTTLRTSAFLFLPSPCTFYRQVYRQVCLRPRPNTPDTHRVEEHPHFCVCYCAGRLCFEATLQLGCQLVRFLPLLLLLPLPACYEATLQSRDLGSPHAPTMASMLDLYEVLGVSSMVRNCWLLIHD